MADQRLRQLAEMLLKDALEMKEGEMFQLNSGTPANPLNKEILQPAWDCIPS